MNTNTKEQIVTAVTAFETETGLTPTRLYIGLYNMVELVQESGPLVDTKKKIVRPKWHNLELFIVDAFYHVGVGV